MTPALSTPAASADTDDRRKRPVWKPLAAAGIGGAVLIATGFGVFASLSATANNTTAQQVDSGVLSLTLANNGTGFTQIVDKLAPLDTVNRFVTLTNNGSLAGKDLGLRLTATGSSSLITDGTSTRALTVTIDSCPTAWTAITTGNGTCTTPTTVLSTRALSGLTGATPISLASDTIAALNGQRHLRITLTLPDQTETIANGATPAPNAAGTIQNQNASLTWTFNENQRTATTTTS